MQKSTVIVIDDKVGPSESLRVLLKYDYNVLCAVSVDEGVRYFSEYTPDLVVMDINMPGKNGIDGLQEIREIDPAITVVMLTGFGSLETAQEALRFGATDYITKPYDVHHMQELVRHGITRTQLKRRQKESETRLTKLNNELSNKLSKTQKLAKRGQAADEFAHDISNPLTNILLGTGLLIDQLGDSNRVSGSGLESVIDSLAEIATNVQRCCKMTQSWKEEDHAANRKLQHIDVSVFLKSLAAEIRRSLKLKKRQVKISGDLVKCGVFADATEMYRIFKNLINNAIHALPDSGGKIEISCAPYGHDAVMKVIDNGTGIQKELLERVFEPYYTSKSPVEGTGLGLAITKKLVEQNNGSIAIESVLNKGSTFVVTLPLTEPVAGGFQLTSGTQQLVTGKS